MNIHLLSSKNATKSCRICLEGDNPEDLISPCLCKGGSAHVHRKCLDNWRSLNKTGRSFKSCDVCQFEYIIEPMIDDPAADSIRLLIFRLLVTRDITFIILLLQAIIIGMAFLLQAAYKENNSIKNLYPTSMSSFGIYYVSSVILLFALLGLFGLIAVFCGCASNTDEPCDCTCHSCCCLGSNCNGSNGNNCCDAEGGGVLLIFIVLMFAVLGVFFGIILSAIIIRKIIKRRTNKLWLRQETKKYIVKDLQGTANELMNRSIQHYMTNSSINTDIDYNNTIKNTISTDSIITINCVEYINKQN